MESGAEHSKRLVLAGQLTLAAMAVFFVLSNHDLSSDFEVARSEGNRVAVPMPQMECGPGGCPLGVRLGG